MSWKHRVVKALGFNVIGQNEQPKRQSNAPTRSFIADNDFNFESNLGEFLATGFDSYTNEGNRQGYDDPSKVNWEKQVELLKVQFDNKFNREIFIKENKYSLMTELLNSTDGIVSNQSEFLIQMKRAENELKFINEQYDLVKEEKGWYLMIHEALHDGFQDGAKKKINELKSLNSL